MIVNFNSTSIISASGSSDVYRTSIITVENLELESVRGINIDLELNVKVCSNNLHHVMT